MTATSASRRAALEAAEARGNAMFDAIESIGRINGLFSSSNRYSQALYQRHLAGARCVWREPGLLDQVRGDDAVDEPRRLRLKATSVVLRSAWNLSGG
jgi:hypothetical protein